MSKQRLLRLKGLAMILCLAIPATIASAVVRYVNLNNPASAAPFLTWATAATNIQDAIDAAAVGDEIVVTNGVYATGATMVQPGESNRVAVTKAVKVRSVNGPDVTVIKGAFGAASFGSDSIRCVYLTNGAVLDGFTLTNGQTIPFGHGGGVWCASTNAVVTNCILTVNWAYLEGGAAFGSTLRNCTLSNNGANSGGAVSQAVLEGCRLAGNTAQFGGGANLSVITGCSLSNNTAFVSAGGAAGSRLVDCLLTHNASDAGGGAGVSTGFPGPSRGSVLIRCTLSWNTAASSGGGAVASTLTDCEISHNSAGANNGIRTDSDYSDGGGTSSCNLTNCILSANDAAGNGGGADGGYLEHCQILGNTAVDLGGGVSHSSASRCTIRGNSAHFYGGGAADSTLDNCLVTGNRAQGGNCEEPEGCSGGHGGGAFASTLNNCTVAANVALTGGGGLYGGSAVNCIVYDNTSTNGANHLLTALNYSCTTAAPVTGGGNIANAPLFANAAAGDYRLRPGSPCIDAATNLSALVAFDFNGLPRPLDGNRDGIAGFDMGAYEFNPLFFTSITSVGNSTRLCWFDTLPGMQLQATPSLSNPVWTNVPFAAGTNYLELPTHGNELFFRLLFP